MKILTPDKWQSFKIGENHPKNDGFKFEKLIEIILKLEFTDNLDWEPTSQTRDGGKDFIHETVQWAEAKMYDSKIQLTVLSKTLVMAVNQGINRVIFFSYSKLTQITSRELSRFAYALGMIIQVFDDELLENLILKHIKNSKIKEFFPNFNVEEYQEKIPPTFKFEQFFSKEMNISSNQLLTKQEHLLRSNRLNINQPCIFELLIYSTSIKETKIELDISNLIKAQWINILNKEKLYIDSSNHIQKTFQPGETYAFRFYFTPIVANPKLIFPAFQIKIGGDQYLTQSFSIEVSKSVRPILVGERVHKYLIDFQERISSSDKVQISVIYGEGGVGKSRFLEESVLKLLKEDYLICSLDGKSMLCSNINKFVIELLVQIWRIPNPNIFDETNTFETSENQTNELERKLHEVIKRGVKNTLQEGDLKDVCYLIEKIITRRRIAILIDNVQALDSLSLALIGNLLNFVGKIGQAQIVLTFNKDELIYSQKATSLFYILTEEPLRKNIVLYHLEKFSKVEVKQFVDSHIKGIDNNQFSLQYPLLFDKICEHISPCPLDLYLFFKYLLDEKIVSIDDGIFYISDFDRFKDALEGLTPNIRDILKYRFNKLIETNNVNALRIFLFLSFVGDANMQDIMQILQIKYEEIDKLIEASWLRIDTQNRIDFYHSKITNYILENHDLLMGKEGENISKALQNSDYYRCYPIMNFALSSLNDKIELFNSALKETEKLFNPNKRNQILAYQLFHYIIEMPLDELSPSLYIKYIHHICILCGNTNNENIISCFEQINKILTKYIPKPQEVILLFNLIRQQASYLCPFEPYKAISILKKGLTRLKSYNDLYSNKILQYVEMDLCNRLSYCYRTVRNEKEAEKTGEHALQIATSLEDITYTCLCNIDLGYIYLLDIKNRETTLFYWEQALNIYKENKDYLMEHELYLANTCIIIEAYVIAIKNNDLSLAIITVERAIELAKQTYSMHNEILGLKAKIIWSIHQNIINKQMIIKMVDALIDRCIITYDKENIIKAYHIRAILADQLKDCKSACIYFKKALTYLKGKTYCSIGDVALLCDFVRFYKSYYPRKELSMLQIYLANKKNWNFLDLIQKEIELFGIFNDGKYNFTT